MKRNLIDLKKLIPMVAAAAVLVCASVANAQTESGPTETTLQVGTELAHPSVLGSSVAATSLSSSSVRVDFSTGQSAYKWEVCWKLGRMNPVPTCSGFASSSAFDASGLTSGTYTVTGLKSDRWYTFRVRGLFYKANGKVQNVWHFVGKAEVKTP